MMEIPTPRGTLKISTGDLGQYNSVYVDLHTDDGKTLPILVIEVPDPEIDYIQEQHSWNMPVPKGEPRIYLHEGYQDDATHLITVGPDKVRIGCERGYYSPEVIR